MLSMYAVSTFDSVWRQAFSGVVDGIMHWFAVCSSPRCYACCLCRQGLCLVWPPGCLCGYAVCGEGYVCYVN
jgi:hypothetical protein